MKSGVFISLVVAILTADVVSAGEQSFHNGDYIVNWEVTGSTIKFIATVKTVGWVGLGISPTANMAGADIFMGGINDADSTTYFNDYHASRNDRPTVDAQNDWTLIGNECSQNGGITVLSFTRELLTDDTSGEDNEISNTKLYFLWSYGASDDIGNRHIERGSYYVNLLEDLEATTPAENGWEQLTFENGNYTVQWIVDSPNIHFKLTVKTRGWVGIGVGPNPNMIGADFFMGGITDSDDVNKTGPYYDDYHGILQRPIVDAENNWELNEEESSQDLVANITVLSISRSLVTNDTSGEDNPIQNAMTYLLWAYHPTDLVEIYHTSTGYHRINLLNVADVDPTTPAGASETTGRLSVFLILFISFFKLML